MRITDGGDGHITMKEIGDDLFLYLDGVKVAKRGHYGTRHAKKWISLVHGMTIVDEPDLKSVIIATDGGAVH